MNDDDFYGETFENRWGAVGQRHVRSGASVPTGLQDPRRVRWGDTHTEQFVFTINDQKQVDNPQLLQIDDTARVWSLNFAMAMATPLEIPVGDSVNVRFAVTAGVGASRIQFPVVLDSLVTSFQAFPVLGAPGIIVDVWQLTVPNIPASQILVGYRLQYSNTHAAQTVRVRIDASASPVFP